MAGTYAGGYHGSGDFEFAGTNQNEQLGARGDANVAAGRRLSEAEHRRREAGLKAEAAAEKKKKKEKAAKKKAAAGGRPAVATSGPGVVSVGKALTAGAGVAAVGQAPTSGPGVGGVGPSDRGLAPTVYGGPGLGVVTTGDAFGPVNFEKDHPGLGPTWPKLEDVTVVTPVRSGGWYWTQDSGWSDVGSSVEQRYGDDGPVTWGFGLAVFGADLSATLHANNTIPRLPEDKQRGARIGLGMAAGW